MEESPCKNCNKIFREKNRKEYWKLLYAEENQNFVDELPKSLITTIDEHKDNVKHCLYGNYLLRLPLSRSAISRDISVLRSFSCKSMLADCNEKISRSVDMNIVLQSHLDTGILNMNAEIECSNRRLIHLKLRQTPSKISFNGGIIPLSKAKR